MLRLYLNHVTKRGPRYASRLNTEAGNRVVNTNCMHCVLPQRKKWQVYLCLRLYAPEALCFRLVRVHGSVGPLVHPTNRNRFTACPSVRPSVCPSVRPSVCPSVRPSRFLGICRRMHGGIGLKFYMLMYLDHLQNWLVHGPGLLIFLNFGIILI